MKVKIKENNFIKSLSFMMHKQCNKNKKTNSRHHLSAKNNNGRVGIYMCSYIIMYINIKLCMYRDMFQSNRVIEMGWKYLKLVSYYLSINIPLESSPH